MKKAIFALVTSLAFASTAFAAAPAVDLAAGQTQIGYSYNNLKTNAAGLGDFGTFHANGIQLAYGISDKLAITGDYLKSDSRSFDAYVNGSYAGSVNDLNYDTTQVGLQYKVSNNIALLAGNVKTGLNWDSSSASSSETYGGVAYKASLANHVDGYASYLKSSNVEDWKAGLTYGLGHNTSIDVGYRHNGTPSITAEGMTVGANYKF